ncbi:MAG: hypothetical protein CMJ65_02475 [Planctomycetaceae bacterium]|jgi:hypothetical protein|nr:hypothetical protein [Planctomycetaceae bacterium]MDP7274779.1 hypothetical protein [Planctomycetaceae bacterium]
MRFLNIIAVFASMAVTAVAGEFALSVTEPAGVTHHSAPVTSGVPFAQGELRSADAVALFLAGPEQRRVPLQTEILSRWPDASVKWLLLDFQIDLQPDQKSDFVLRYGKHVSRNPVKNPILITDGYKGLTIDTRRIRLHLDRKNFRPLNAVWLDTNKDGTYDDSERITAAASEGIQLTDPSGRTFRAHLSRMRLVREQQGPLRACLRMHGTHSDANGRLFRYVLRLHVFRGRPDVRIDYTFINDHAAMMMTPVSSLSYGLALDGDGPFTHLLQGPRDRPTRLFQLDDRRYHVDGRPAGRQAQGWLSVSGPRGGLAVGVRHFWQNWPKALSLDKGRITVGLLPSFPDGTYDGRPIRDEAKLYYYLRKGRYSFKIGMARTHELWVRFFHRPPDPQRLADHYRGLQQRLLAQPSPQRIAVTRALGTLPPARPGITAGYDKWMAGYMAKHLREQAEVREYGLLNYGDWYSIPWDSWGNLEYDTARCFFQQYLRTGDRRYFDRAEIAAQHYVDVDVAHAVNNELQEYGGSWQIQPGRVWAHCVGHTGGYYGRYDGERYHDEAPLVMKGAYQLGLIDNGHTWIGGVFDHHLLTGSRRAREIAVLATDAIARRTPTRYTDHLRGIGWPLHMMMAAWDATGDQAYLAAATRQWRRLRKHLDPKRGWVIKLAYGHCSEASDAGRCRGQNAYMLALTLSGVARYHAATRDPEVLVGLTAGIDQLIRSCWNEKHKAFHLSSCRHSKHLIPPKQNSPAALSAQAIAYESAVTGNREHRRIGKEAIKALIEDGVANIGTDSLKGQTGYGSMMFLFTPFGLPLLESE